MIVSWVINLLLAPESKGHKIVFAHKKIEMNKKQKGRNKDAKKSNQEAFDHKAGKGAHGRISGDSESTGGSREGNAGQEADRYESFGNR